MKKIVIIVKALFYSSLSFSIDIVVKNRILKHIADIKFTLDKGPYWFAGSSFMSYEGCLKRDHEQLIAILNQNNIQYPEIRSKYWVYELEQELAKTIFAPDSKPKEIDDNIIDITGVNKKKIVLALWQRDGFGIASLSDEELNEELSDARLKQILDEGFIDYFRGTALKIDIRGNSLDASLYNRDNGRNCAQEVISQLRKN